MDTDRVYETAYMLKQSIVQADLQRIAKYVKTLPQSKLALQTEYEYIT